MSEGKYEGTPVQKINIQVLVYGEFSKYTQDYDLVDSVDNKGKQSKVKQYKGTYSKVAETSTRWDWVPLDKIQQIYVDYDPKVHTPTCFVAPWQDPRTDTTSLAYPQNVKEGTIFISPSYTLHFVHPNQVRKHRTIISFDLLPKLPDHQSV